MKYNKETLEKIVNESKSIADVCRKLGLGTRGGNFRTIKKYILKFDLNISHFMTKVEVLREQHRFKLKSFDDVLVEKSTYNRSSLRKRLIKEGLLLNKCSVCGLSDMWCDKPITLQLDHINGVGDDNRLINLRLLCPNCHSQTDTFCGRNKSKKAEKNRQRIMNNGFTDLELAGIKSRRKVKNRPDKEVLYNDVLLNGFLKTGRIYGVTDNAIRKWCKAYGLPTKSSDYKNKSI